MFDEIKKSINSVLYERAKSPLFGTFGISWLFWNWRIFYVTLFMSKEAIPNKLDFIHKYLYNPSHLFWYPLFSTIVLLTIIPFVNNGAFWLDMLFKNWRIEKKQDIEKKQLLTIEQSILLREQIKNQEDRFQKITSEKDEEIKLLKIQIDALNQKNKEPEKNVTNIISQPTQEAQVNQLEINQLYSKLVSKNYVKAFLSLGASINKNEFVDDDSEITNYFVELGLINSVNSNYGQRTRLYQLTNDGEAVMKKARLAS